MGIINTSRPNMTDEQIWQQIVADCLSTQKTINCGSALRRKAILEMNKKVVKMYEALRKIVEEGTRCVELMQQDKPIREIYNIDEVDRIARQAKAKAEGK